MEALSLTVPLRQVGNIVVLVQALIFAGVFMSPPFRRQLSNQLLAAALLIMAAIKADQLYQMLGGLAAYPEYGFALAPFQALMTPVLYLFVVSKAVPNFALERRHLWHLTPFALFFLYLLAVYYRLPTDEKAALLASGGFASPLHRLVVPLIGDAIQLGYVVAALKRLNAHGLSLRNWFSRLENRDLRWLRRLMIVWGAVFVFHTMWTIAAGVFAAAPFARGVLDILNLVHLGFVTALILMGATSVGDRLGVGQPGADETRGAQPDAAPALKYVASTLSAAERRELFEKAAAALKRQRLYLTPDLTLRHLADHLSATPREVSEALNGVGDQSFFEFINRARVEHAKGLLAAAPDMKIIEIAFQSGFNSKTAFNESFRKYCGQTPGAYRRSHASSPDGARPAEKLAP
ncbi:MAG: helix-turn-helix domain-containing protein [Pseudomonadota bacterium]